ncbi:MAG: hypothetical protein GEV11_17010 [Streptosporangiales bacterium]|nr:hypothetical protein [Streptosporangiales bacterium]
MVSRSHSRPRGSAGNPYWAPPWSFAVASATHHRPRSFRTAAAARDARAHRRALNVAAKQNAPVKLVAPSEGLAVYDYFLGMTAAGKHKAAATTFVNWYFSKRGQQLIASFGEYPARSDVPLPPVQGVKLPALDSDKVYRPDPEKELKRSEQLQKDWNKTFGYSS